nr:MAG TPA: hypothetical protein [Caudoviricetes sp.]
MLKHLTNVHLNHKNSKRKQPQYNKQPIKIAVHNLILTISLF